MNELSDLPLPLSPRFLSDLNYATSLHARQLLKGAKVPYISHLYSVAALVMEAGGTEAELTAAILHGAVEDQGGVPILFSCSTPSIASAIALKSSSFI
ncbi:MAG: HD domain-containing protein [bacterium]